VSVPRVPRLATALTLLAALLLAVLVALVPAQPARAGTFEVGDTTVQTEDPRSISFRLAITSSAGLQSARFTYKVLNPDGNVGGSGDADFGSYANKTSWF